MAFSRGLIQGLINPSFGSNLATVGEQIGSAQATGRRRRMLTDLLGPLSDPMATSADLAAVSKGLLPVDPKMAMQVAGTARQAAAREEEERRRPKTRADYFRSNPQELAGLYEKFKSDSIEAFIAGQGPLRPLDEESKAPLSGYGKQLVDAGISRGSEEFITAMSEYNDAVVSGRTKGIAYKGPLEQTQFLMDRLRSDPFAQRRDSIVEKVNQVESIQRDLETGNVKPEAVALLQRVTSELFNSDTRAASEIDRLTQNKGFARTLADAIEGFSGEGVTEKSRKNLLDIVNAMKNVATFYHGRALGLVVDNYGEYVDEDVIQRFEKSNASPAFYRAPDSKEESQMPALPPGATLDSNNPFN
jgi:hypothetical protein